MQKRGETTGRPASQNKFFGVLESILKEKVHGGVKVLDAAKVKNFVLDFG